MKALNHAAIPLCLALSLLFLLQPGILKDFALMKIIISSFTLFILPGYFLAPFFIRDEKIDFPELACISFGISMVIITFLCIFIFNVKSNITCASFFLLSINFLLFAVALKKNTDEHLASLLRREYEETHGKWLHYAMLISIACLSFMLFKVGGNSSVVKVGLTAKDQSMGVPSLSDEALHIIVIRKISENKILTKKNIDYAPLEHPYPYRVYHFALALLAKFTGLDPLAVYAKFRGVAGFLSLITFYCFCKNLFNNRSMAEILTLSASFLAFTNYAGQVRDIFHAQLIPISHPTDIAIGLLFPLSLFFCLKFINTRENAAGFFILASLFHFCMLNIHPRESVQLVAFLLVPVPFYTAFRVENKKQLITRSFLLSLIISASLILYVSILSHASSIPIVAAFQFQTKQFLSQAFKNPSHYLIQPLPAEDIRMSFALVPLSSLAYAALPFLIPFLRKNFACVFITSNLLFWFIILKSGILSALVISATYSEFLMFPFKLTFYLSVIVFGLFLYMIVFSISEFHKESPAKSLNYKQAKAYIPAILALMFLTIAPSYYLFHLAHKMKLNRTLINHLLDYLSVWLLGATALLWIILSIKKSMAAKIASAGECIFSSKLRNEKLSLMLLLIMLVIFYKATHFYQQKYLYPRTLLHDYRLRSSYPDITNFSEWYNASSFSKTLPLDMVQFIRERIPQNQMFASRLKNRASLVIPLLTNQQIYCMGWGMAEDSLFMVDYMHFRKNLKNRGKSTSGRYNIHDILFAYENFDSFLEKYPPLFNSFDTDETLLQTIKLFKIQYIIVPPEYHDRYVILSRNHNKMLKKTYEKDGFSLYQVNVGLLRKQTEKNKT